MGETLAAHAPSAENMPAIYDAARGKPVLHDTALQLHVNYTDSDTRDPTVSQLRIFPQSRVCQRPTENVATCQLPLF